MNDNLTKAVFDRSKEKTISIFDKHMNRFKTTNECTQTCMKDATSAVIKSIRDYSVIAGSHSLPPYGEVTILLQMLTELNDMLQANDDILKAFKDDEKVGTA